MTAPDPHWADEDVTLWHGDCLTVMADLPDACVDAVVTDPPYLLGFMGKAWDSRTAHQHLDFHRAWVDHCHRLLKPGGYLLAFGGTRTWHRLACAVEDAGFEVRDSIAWLHGQGFPKGTQQLKPAFEPIVVARRPEANGVLNIDACRVTMSDADRAVVDARSGGTDKPYTVYGPGIGTPPGQRFTSAPGGRWPTNVLLDDHTADTLDAQNPHTRDGVAVNRNRTPDNDRATYTSYAFGNARGGDVTYGGEGGPSRFFPTFRYEAKAPTSERPRDGDVAHPTVKPLDLMRWLVRLVTPSGGLLLDPFAGSGTTAEACVLEGMRCWTVEQDPTYLPLITQRLSKPLQVGLGF